MSDIFVSYAREDRRQAQRLAEALEGFGWSVWWDPKLRAGDRFDDVIQSTLKESTCVVVLWSRRSLKSRYVIDEATYALDHSKLIPVAIEKLKDLDLPFRFSRLHTEEIVNPHDTDKILTLEKLAEAIQNIIQPSGNGSPEPIPAVSKSQAGFLDHEIQRSHGFPEEATYDFHAKVRLIAGKFWDSVKRPTAIRSIITAVVWLTLGSIFPKSGWEIFLDLGFSYGTAKNGGLAFGAGLFSAITILILKVGGKKVFWLSRVLYIVGAVGFAGFAVIAVGQLLLG